MIDKKINAGKHSVPLSWVAALLGAQIIASGIMCAFRAQASVPTLGAASYQMPAEAGMLASSR